MPSIIEVDYLDGEFTVSENEPATVAEVVEILGEEAVRSGAIADNRYRNKYPRVYKRVSAELTALGFPRAVIKSETKKDSTIKQVLEGVNDHARAFLTGRKDADGTTIPPQADAREVLAEMFTRIANEEPLYVKGERAGGTGKIAKDALDKANAYFAAGTETVESIITAIEGYVSGYKVGRDADESATPESLARGIMALGKEIQRRSQAEILGVLSKPAA